MKKIILLTLSVFVFGILLTTISADSEISEHERWCFANFKDEELEKCLNEPRIMPGARAGCMFCED